MITKMKNVCNISFTQETGNPKIFLGWAGYWVMSLLLPKPKTDLFNFEYTPSATQKFWVAEENVK